MKYVPADPQVEQDGTITTAIGSKGAHCLIKTKQKNKYLSIYLSIYESIEKKN